MLGKVTPGKVTLDKVTPGKVTPEMVIPGEMMLPSSPTSSRDDDKVAPVEGGGAGGQNANSSAMMYVGSQPLEGRLEESDLETNSVTNLKTNSKTNLNTNACLRREWVWKLVRRWFLSSFVLSHCFCACHVIFPSGFHFSLFSFFRLSLTFGFDPDFKSRFHFLLFDSSGGRVS